MMSQSTKYPTLSDEDLEQLEANAKLMFSIEEIAIILTVDPKMLQFMVTETGSPEYIRFKKGRLEAEGKVRQSIYDLALNGSSPAQTQMLELIEHAKLHDIL